MGCFAVIYLPPMCLAKRKSCVSQLSSLQSTETGFTQSACEHQNFLSLGTDEFSFSSRARFFLRARGFCSSRDGPRGKEGSWYFVSENTLTCNDTDAKRSSPFPTFFIGLKTAKIDLQDLSKLLQTRLPRIARVGEMSLVQVFNS